MRTLLGYPVAGRAFYGTRVLTLVPGPGWQATARHELTHVELGNRWGSDYQRWISEGTATWVGNPFAGADVHGLVQRRLVTAGRVLTLEELEKNFSSHPDEVTYLQAASVAKFLFERFGIDALRAVWRQGLRAVPTATGLDRQAFEREWMKTVAASK